MGRSDQARLTASLVRLTIEGIGLIERAEIEFGTGFTAFTGETGSGKTMLLGALGAALGGRVERDLVRGERARVTLELVPGEAVREWLAAGGIESRGDDDCVVVRDLLATGRSQARVNGTVVSAGQLRELGLQLADAVGAGEALRLVEPAFAREMLDRFAGTPAAMLRERLECEVAERWRLREERDALREGFERERAEREFARFALAEIDAVAPIESEDERLRERRDVLAGAQRIGASLARARAALQDEGGAVDTLGDAAHALAGLARYGTAFGTLAASAGALQSDAGAFASEVARAADALELDPQELEGLGARLDVLETLKKKYGGSIAAVLAARARLAESLDAGAGRDLRLGALGGELERLDAAIGAAATALHEVRAAAVRAGEERIAAELRALAMPAARFTIALEPLDEIAAHGRDRVEFRFSANPGEPERPLARIASGGERSRVLLALVVVLADPDAARAFVFDEIDAGIGGATAVAVGARLKGLARVAQVVCVTHLAQIASCADAHYALRKFGDDEGTTIEVVPLRSNEARLSEIARMLSGDTSRVSLEHAATLVAAANAYGTR